VPRQLVKRFSQFVHARRDRWYLRLFGDHLTDTHLWSLNRHSITKAFGVGIGISFIPLPIHLPLVVSLCVLWRLNVAVGVAGCYIVNPFTMVPIYFAAYRVGAWLLRYRTHRFEFHLTWNWLEHGLGPAWKPFLLGCLVCGLTLGYLGRFALEISWRIATLRRYRVRRERRRAYTLAS
jgi:uncharacterized protein (DUF2062 family)